jgi:hypothetical protein
MSYYILPKKQSPIQLNPIFENENENICTNPIISFSLINYISLTKNLISKITSDEADISFLYRILNPYEFIHNKVSDSKFSVSKIKSSSNQFYILLEIINMFNIFDIYINKSITFLHCGANNASTIECVNAYRDNNDDINYAIQNNYIDLNIEWKSIDFMYFEVTENNYIFEMLVIIYTILTSQNVNGTCVIKIDTLFCKPILDAVYLLTRLYEKVYIVKPNASDIFTDDRYLICKQFIFRHENSNILKSLKLILNTPKRVCSLINVDLPHFFINKIEESNVIIGHLQLEYIDQLISIIKNKNRDEKIETIKKTNIQKCIQWCEKYKIPYNKFIEKLNIFLPIVEDILDK